MMQRVSGIVGILPRRKAVFASSIFFSQAKIREHGRDRDDD